MEFFPERPAVEPKIYAYEDSSPEYKVKCLKILFRSCAPNIRPLPFF
jgi:hypothetical protein